MTSRSSTQGGLTPLIIKARTHSNVTLRPYQEECIRAIESHPEGSFLVYMATGLGKTATMSHIPFEHRMLILSHREELVRQPARYFNCPVGIEQGANYSDGHEPVVSASVKSLINRLDKFKPDEFDVIVTDEAHHAVASTYKKIYKHFQPRLHLGFTATPNRADDIGLESVFQDIIFERNLLWGIKNKYLCDLDCKHADIQIDLSGVNIVHGDFDQDMLNERTNTQYNNEGVATAISRYAKPPVLVFAVSIAHARALADLIPGAVSVIGGEPREHIVKDFMDGKFPVLVNCMVFTEGTDIPNINTVVIARPTRSETLYAQMVGRATRRIPGKERAILIDCISANSDVQNCFCTAPSLIGIDTSLVPQEKLSTLEGSLLDMPEKVEEAASGVSSYLKGIKAMNLLARKMRWRTHNMHLIKAPDGSLYIPMSYPQIVIPCPDELGRVEYEGVKIPMQRFIDAVYKWLRANCEDKRCLWDLKYVKYWGVAPASRKQKHYLRNIFGIDGDSFSKSEACQVIAACEYQNQHKWPALADGI